jgi:hypothetical protein
MLVDVDVFLLTIKVDVRNCVDTRRDTDPDWDVTVPLPFWRRIFGPGYVHLTAISCTGFVAMSAGFAYVNTAEPGCVPTTSRNAWHWMVEMSTLGEAETMRRPQTWGRSARS